MDAKTQWKISSKVNTLVDAIVACRKELIDGVKKRCPFSRNVKLAYCDVHASPKLSEMLSLSDVWKDHTETLAETEKRQTERPYSQETVADCGLFNVVKDTIIGDEAIRVVAQFDTGEGTWECMYGTVELVTQ
jgi:hypothetical protein